MIETGTKTLVPMPLVLRKFCPVCNKAFRVLWLSEKYAYFAHDDEVICSALREITKPNRLYR